jgi:hypothetical protein
MTYKPKKPDRTGSKVTGADLKHLKRIYAKYGEASFDAACATIKNLPPRGPGRGKHYIGNLISVLIVVDEIAKNGVGVEGAFDILDGRVPSHTGKNYKRAGLKSIYYTAANLMASDSKFAALVKQFREARAHPEDTVVIGDTLPAGLVMVGPRIPLMMKIKSE